METAIPIKADVLGQVRLVPVDRPWVWLARGVQDMLHAPRISLVYGLGLAAVSLLLVLGVVLAGLVELVLPLAAGFFFVAPLLAVGLYETSRRLQAGEPLSLWSALFAWRRNSSQIALMGLILMLVHLVWVRIATLLYALFFHDMHPTFDSLVEVLVFSKASLAFLVVGTTIGAILATIVFAISAVAIPMLLDRNVSVFTAMATSWTVTRLNPQPMALWAALIVVFTAFGLMAFSIGLVLVLPLLGHATWHAYKDLVA